MTLRPYTGFGRTGDSDSIMLLLPAIFAFAAPTAAAQTAPPTAAQSSATARQVLQDCNAHKFDTVVTAEVDGKMQSKRVRLCGQVGQSDSDWVRTLEDSVTKIEASDAIAKPMRDAMATSLKVEVIRLRSTSVPAGAIATAPAPPLERAENSGDFTLKPRAVRPTGSSDGLAVYNGLPPLPDPVAVKAAGSAAYVPPPPIVRPKLDVQCFGNGAIAGGPCYDLDRHGLVVVRARDTVGPGVNLHFILKGEDRGQVALSGMKKGQRLNFRLPDRVCRGTVGGRLELRVMVAPAGGKYAPQRAETVGPVVLRCA